MNAVVCEHSLFIFELILNQVSCGTSQNWNHGACSKFWRRSTSGTYSWHATLPISYTQCCPSIRIKEPRPLNACSIPGSPEFRWTDRSNKSCLIGGKAFHSQHQKMWPIWTSSTMRRYLDIFVYYSGILFFLIGSNRFLTMWWSTESNGFLFLGLVLGRRMMTKTMKMKKKMTTTGRRRMRRKRRRKRERLKMESWKDQTLRDILVIKLLARLSLHSQSQLSLVKSICMQGRSNHLRGCYHIDESCPFLLALI